jgi:hypothetical protein
VLGVFVSSMNYKRGRDVSGNVAKIVKILFLRFHLGLTSLSFPRDIKVMVAKIDY